MADALLPSGTLPSLSILARLDPREPPFGKQTYFFEELAREAEGLDLELAVLACPAGSDAPVALSPYRFRGAWQPTADPGSTLIYDRLFPVAAGLGSGVEEVRRRLPPGARFLNPLPLVAQVADKFSFHRFLEEAGFPTLPTILLSAAGPSDLARLLGETGALYGKPSKGMGGEGIVVATGTPEAARLQTAGARSLVEVGSAEEVLDALRAHFGEGEAVLMPRASGSLLAGAPFDFRVLVQNRAARDYAVTGMVARIGPAGTWVSNLSSGGRARPVEDLVLELPARWSGGGTALRDALTAQALECADRLHSAFGSFAELALDFVLDGRGPILIEANAKPARWVFSALAYSFPPGTPEAAHFAGLRRLAVRAPLVYARSILDGAA